MNCQGEDLQRADESLVLSLSDWLRGGLSDRLADVDCAIGCDGRWDIKRCGLCGDF